MPPGQDPSPPPPTLDYEYRFASGRQRGARLARGIAGVLSIAATALTACVLGQGWHRHRPVIACAAALLGLAAALLAWRTATRAAPASRIAWITALAAFALWTTIVLSNQFHGRPPPSDRYFIACFGISGLLSACGIAFDPQRPSGA
jgi:hypothetical protein